MLSSADLQLQRGEAIAQDAQERAILERQFRTRTIPGIVNRRAGHGAYFAGGTTQELGRAQEDVADTYGRMQMSLNKTLADIARNQVLLSAGIAI